MTVYCSNCNKQVDAIEYDDGLHCPYCNNILYKRLG